MKKTTLFLTLILYILTFSCSPDSNSEPQETDSTENNIEQTEPQEPESTENDTVQTEPQEPQPTEKKLVKTEKKSETRKVDYTYNSNDLLSSSTGVYNSIEYVLDYTYNSENKLTEYSSQESGTSTYSDHYTYTYNLNGLLSNYSANNENVTLAYNGNTVTVTGKIEGNANSQAELELSNNGLIIKFTESNQYTNFGYDTYGNLISTKSYDNSNNLISEYIIQYDNKINPFYGQFESIYIERFIEFFWEFEGVYIGSFEGYSFPFQKNNITSINKVGKETTTYSYSYDSDNYPTNVIEESYGDTFTFQIKYY